MLKRIGIEQLRPGMFIHDLSSDFESRPFIGSRFMLDHAKQTDRIVAAGIKEIYIDTSQGLDVPGAPTAADVSMDLDRAIAQISAARTPVCLPVDVSEELTPARNIRLQAQTFTRNAMQNIRRKRPVDFSAATPIVESITCSLSQNAGALLSLCQIKDKDDYTFLHSVSVCTFMVAFARSLGLDAIAIRHAGLGGLVHDLGKAYTPEIILNTPGPLSDEEFAVIRHHPADGHRILESQSGLPDAALQIALQHHERLDGSGYPGKLKGDDISPLGQMAAIVDVYVAITADRHYRKGIPPAEALRKLLEWSKFHFDRELVQAFIRCVGIYPVGSVVRLESGRVAIVIEQSAQSLLQPKVRVVYHAKHKRFLMPEDLDLSRSLGHGGGDRIVTHEAPDAWRIDAQRFM